MIAALFLCIYNFQEDGAAQEQAQTILSALKSELPESTEAESEKYDLFSEYEQSAEPSELIIEIDQQKYIGIISVPDLGIELPVMSEWSYPNLKASPCRYKGSVQENNLMIIAHNYRSHFGRIGELNSGDEIIFMSADGSVHYYEVINTEQIIGTDIEKMDFGAGEEWDLTLFTCTLSGQSRVTVRAEAITNENEKTMD